MLKKFVKDVLWRMQGGYQPKRFWEKTARNFMDDPWQVALHDQHTWILQKIKECKPKNILEIGCGFGRNIKFLIDQKFPAKNLTGCDISKKMIDNAKKYIDDSGVLLIVADAKRLPFIDKSFEVVLVHGVFMHVKPEDIDTVVKETIRVTKKYIINVEQNYNGNVYTFVHNYKKIYTKNHAKIIEYKKNKKNGLDYYYVKVR